MSRGPEPRQSTGVHGHSAMRDFPAYADPEATRVDWMHTCARAGDALLDAMLGKSSARSKNFTRATHYDEEVRVGEAHARRGCKYHARTIRVFIVYALRTQYARNPYALRASFVPSICDGWCGVGGACFRRLRPRGLVQDVVRQRVEPGAVGGA